MLALLWLLAPVYPSWRQITLASVIPNLSSSQMFPHRLLYTSCTRPNVYDDEVPPLRHNLIGPLAAELGGRV